ncbi:MAG TPA: S8 family peptidase [Actinophytocola sp.]|jgi:hypothetical protein|uniref:S8 family peptidase n=1 Tax=Actinophytocola sp. TaxID=1872138 RepID=UPI002E003694|nr:S8 family peptidase [Actinophytocola sp.]
MTTFSLRTLAVIASAVAVTAGMAGAAPTAVAAAPGEGTIRDEGVAQAVPDNYVVVLANRVATTDARTLAAQYGGQVTFTYTAALNGFAVTTTAGQARKLAADPRVAYVAQDQKVSLPPDTLGKPVSASTGVGIDTFVQPNPPAWGLDRVDQRSLPLDAKYFYPSLGATARAYIIDTGIRFTHQEFGGRAVLGIDVVGGVTPPGFDCNGHGTHIAGTVGGKTVGLAKGVQLVAVRVLSCTGAGTISQIIAGIDWITQDNRANPRPSVASMPLGGGLSTALNDAVTASIAANVHYSVASGGSNANACNFSPASTPRATTVGSTDQSDNRASFSNFGPCIDLFAPGVGITSAWATADDAYLTLSGSTATAHATGAAALWRHKFPADNADQVAAALAANATPVVGNPGTGSPNLLLFMGMIPV